VPHTAALANAQGYRDLRKGGSCTKGLALPSNEYDVEALITLLKASRVMIGRAELDALMNSICPFELALGGREGA
jgi:hypothetical protein